ncbi:MAG: hypothetical protein LBV72_07035 [Tannerella sp.]|nr:hypothetical protein [Tannerella sp.]
MNIQEIIPIQTNKQKVRIKKTYVKPDSVKQLEQDYFSWKYKDSVIPDNCRFITKFRDDASNGLTKCLQAWSKINGAHFQRMNTTGIFDYKIGKYRHSGSTKGVTDTLIIYNGIVFNIEIKIGKDKQSEKQLAMQKSIESAGGIYIIIKNYNDFLLKIKNYEYDQNS